MLTSHPSTGIQDRTERTKEEHSVLGRAMQILNDNPILKAPVLQGSLAAHNEELHMTQTTLNLDDLTKIWTTFQNTLFRPSICYLVTPVRIDSAREEQVTRVMERKIVVG
jgi:4-hydroxy-3-methylbut-2-enyl diphosphate reductase IspH